MHTSTKIVAAVAAAALALPAYGWAGVRPDNRAMPDLIDRYLYSHAPTANVASPSNGFAWSDAAIGSALALALLTAVLLGIRGLRTYRNRARRAALA